MCIGCWAGVTYLGYTVLTSSNKSKTTVHCCDPALSVLVMLVSRNVFHVVSALQSTVFIYIFLADQISCRSYVSSVLSCAVPCSLCYSVRKTQEAHLINKVKTLHPFGINRRDDACQ